MLNQKAAASASLQDTNNFLKKRVWRFDYCVRDLQEVVSSNLKKEEIGL